MKIIFRKVNFILAILILIAGVSCNWLSRQAPVQDGQAVTDTGENAVDVPTTTNDRFRFYEIEKVLETENADTEMVRSFTLAHGIKILTEINTTFTVNTAEVNVTTLVPEHSSDLVALYSKVLSTNATSGNTVVMGNGGVSVIESEDPFAADVVRYELDLAPMQKIKMTPHTLYGEAVFVGEALITGDRTAEMSEDLGFGLDTVLNQEILLEGQRVRVNFIDPADDVGALRAMDALAVRKRSDEGIFILDDFVIEVSTQDPETAENIFRLINVPPLSRSGSGRFTVEFSAIPISSRDYARLSEVDTVVTSGVSTEELLALDPLFEFNGSLPLFLCQERTSVELTPEGAISLVDDSIASVTFESSLVDISSVVHVEMVVDTGNNLGVGPELPLPYTARTSFWPVGEEAILEIVRGCLDTMEGEGYLVLAQTLSEWVHEHVVPEANEGGSRVAVSEAIAAGHGDSWTRSDVFITLARTAGIPARQVAGWVYGVGPRVWSQVWLPEEGYWLNIDTGREEIGIDSFYIPIWGTRDGRMAYIYTEGPQVKRFSGR